MDDKEIFTRMERPHEVLQFLFQDISEIKTSEYSLKISTRHMDFFFYKDAEGKWRYDGWGASL